MLQQILFIAFVAIIMFSQYQVSGARKMLTETEQLKLFDLSSQYWQYLLYIFIALFGFFALNLELLPAGFQLSHKYISDFTWLGFMLAAIGVGFYFTVRNYQRMQEMELPGAYLTRVTVYRAVIYIALIDFVLCMFFFR